MSLVRKIYRSWTPSDIETACRLCLITDVTWLGDRSLHACTAEAIVGGATFVRLRNRDISTMELINCARNLAPVCRIANIPLVVEGDIEAAKAAGIDGVHLTSGDISCSQARSELGNDVIIGVSVARVEEAIAAEAAGASYVSAGPMFRSDRPGLEDAELVSTKTLHNICQAVSIPVMAAGGIHASNIPALVDSGIAGVALKAAILSSSDIEAAAQDLKQEIDTYLVK